MVRRVGEPEQRIDSRSRAVIVGCLALLTALPMAGCSKPEAAAKNEAPYMASGGTPATDDSASPASEIVPPSLLPNLQVNLPPEGPTSPAATQAIPATPPARDSVVGRTQLKADLSVSQLVDFLGVADRDMQEIWSRLPQIRDGRNELIRIAKMKLEAARRLKQLPDADDAARSAGARGELQALSHLASFSDVTSAKALEELAVENLQSSDPDLASDSRLVLIGFALESLNNGADGAEQRLIEYIDQIAASARSATDVPTLMVMGQTRDALANHGYIEQANHVRDVIIKMYANSPNPDLAMAAAELADNALFDSSSQLVSDALEGKSVALDSWKSEIDRLIAQAPDRRTVEYLAGAALQLEAAAMDDLVQATLDALTKQFPESDSDAGREVRIAVAAREARRNIVGVRFNPQLPAVDGTSIAIDPYLGRVVLVPFWAAAVPESLQLLGVLKEIQAAHPQEVAIVGVNLDGNDPLLREFLEQTDLGFPSFRSKSTTEGEVANEVAAQFGIASMPFLAILDREGKVAALNFTGKGIQERVDQLRTK